jgi:hypothetical protein
MTKPDEHNPAVRMVHPPTPIPVFNCQVIVTPSVNGSPWLGRSANFEGLEASGDSERAVLQQIVKAFKSLAAQKLKQGEELAQKAPPENPLPGEVVRWIAVHL